MDANTVLIRLAGSFQSWGDRSNWTSRNTAKFPTKSAVVGLIGAALGWRQDQLPMIDKSVRFGVKTEKAGSEITDYHTVISGVMSRKGVKPGYTMVSHRYYLGDASFLVAVMGSPEFIAKIAVALQAPVWPLFLGRKCCIPSEPIFVSTGNYADLIEALGGCPFDGEIEGGDTLRHDRLVGDRVYDWRLTTKLKK
jgi:CRISPR system Cascade subunit CasD